MPSGAKGLAYCIYSNDTSVAINMGQWNKNPIVAPCVPYGLNRASGGTPLISTTGLYYLSYFNVISGGTLHIIMYSSRTFTGKFYFDK